MKYWNMTNSSESVTAAEPWLELVSAETLAVFNLILVFVSSVVNVPGIVLNLINVVIFARLGLSDTTNISLLSLAVADIGVLLPMAGFGVIYSPVIPWNDWRADLIDAVDYVLGWPHVMFGRVAGLLTAFITVERFLCVAVPLKVKAIITPRRTGIIALSIFGFMIASTTPAFSGITIATRFNPVLNMSTQGLVSDANSHFLENISLAVSIFAEVTSFVVVTVFTFGLIKTFAEKARWRNSTSSSSKNTQITSRDKAFVKMVLFISLVFIACSLPGVTGTVAMLFAKDYNVRGREKNIFVASFGVFFNLGSINSSVTFFIYMKMSSRFREKFWTLLKRGTAQTTNNTLKGLSHSMIDDSSLGVETRAVRPLRSQS